MRRELLGEFIGTFLLILFGCGAVAAAVLFEAFSSLFEVASIWGIGVMMAIFASRNLCPAHLNPAVSIAMVIANKLEVKKLPLYVLSQFLGGFIASAVLYLTFQDAINTFELNHNIIRGTETSVKTAMMFGEFYPNPGFADKFSISTLSAFSLEALGTFILVFVIFSLDGKMKNGDLMPILIGATIVLLICLIAPFTQAGFNPARDFAPRLFSYFAGWGNVAIPSLGVIIVYVLGPIVGGIIGAIAYRLKITEQ
ncbi:MAG: aquaporin family protein [Cytophagales bacterium]|nr:aquaporin family protein [Cytophagales bacterium]